MAEHTSVGDGGDVAFEDVEIGAADRGRVDTDDRVGVVDDHRVGRLLPCLVAGAMVNERLHDGFLWSERSIRRAIARVQDL